MILKSLSLSIVLDVLSFTDRMFKVTVDLQSAFRKMLCLRAALEKTMVNYISLES